MPVTRRELDARIAALYAAEDAPWSGLRGVTRAPLWGAQDAAHPVFERLAAEVARHRTPAGLLAERGGDAAEWTVLSLCFPRRPEYVRENARAVDLPPPSWFRSKAAMARGMPLFARALAGGLEAAGTPAFTASDAAGESGLAAGAERYFCTWSERHVAYACGLGTFGLNGALITRAGVAHRLVSLLLKARPEPFDTVPGDPFADCLRHNSGTCGACIARCPVGALSDAGHDTPRCGRQAYVLNGARVRAAYGMEMPGCALCMCGVPCSTRTPRRPASS